MRSRSDLHEYQLKAIEYIKEKERCALFLFMGAGKSIITLTAITDLLDSFMATRVLVIAPLRVANSVWPEEPAGWDHTSHLRVSRITGSVKSRMAALQRNADIYTINRENVVWLVKHFGDKWPFDAVVIDESSSFKSAASKRWKALKRVMPKTEYMVLLTGTPSPNGLLDLWAQMFLIDKGEGLGKTMTAYKQRFFESDFMGYNFTPRAGSADKIHSIIAPHCLSMSADDYLSLPDRIDLTETVTLPPAAMRQYDDFEKTLLIELEDGEEIEALSAAVLANKLLQLSNGAMYTDENGSWSEVHMVKLDALSEIADDNPDDNILVAYSFKTDLERLQKRFPRAVVLDKDPETIRRWNRGEISMLLAHPACLHPRTEVLTEFRGWVKIVNVEKGERVHDGVEFVSHKGCHYSGTKSVIEKFGIWMTPCHKILIEGKWVEAKDVRDCKDTRRKARYQYPRNGQGHSYVPVLRGTTSNAFAKRSKIQPGEKTELPALHKDDPSQHDEQSHLEDMERNGVEVYEKIRTVIQALWREGHTRVLKMGGFQRVLQGHGAILSGRFANRQDRRKWGLRKGELSLGHPYGAAIEQEEFEGCVLPRGGLALGGILQKGRLLKGSDYPSPRQRNERGRGCGRLENEQVPEREKVSPVYDLVDCGPRNRFLIRNDDGDVFISHNSAGHGLNLQSGGSLCVWFGLNWSLELYQQFNARLHRQGQQKPVRIVHIVAAGTIDERVVGVLSEKDAGQKRLLDVLKVK